MQVLGSGDTPAVVGMTLFDFNTIHVASVSDISVGGVEYRIQIALGATGAAALASNDFTDLMYTGQTSQLKADNYIFTVQRKAVGTLAWVRIHAVGKTGSTMNFYTSLHEYLPPDTTTEDLTATMKTSAQTVADAAITANSKILSAYNNSIKTVQWQGNVTPST